MSKPWTREHDAHIARECEGFEVHRDARGEFYHKTSHNVTLVPQYNTDEAKLKRAAEAWRSRDEFARSYLVQSKKGSEPAWAMCIDLSLNTAANSDGDFALGWALYAITRGKDH